MSVCACEMDPRVSLSAWLPSAKTKVTTAESRNLRSCWKFTFVRRVVARVSGRGRSPDRMSCVCPLLEILIALFDNSTSLQRADDNSGRGGHFSQDTCHCRLFSQRACVHKRWRVYFFENNFVLMTNAGNYFVITKERVSRSGDGAGN